MTATIDRHGSATVTTPSDLEILITRRFDAPAALVFTAWTTPAYVRRWWGYATSPLIVCDIDLRVGGQWRYVTRDAGGVELGWHGTYREIVPAERIVTTEVFEGYPDAATLNTLVLTEDDGVTTLAVTVLHTTKQHRDGHLDSGMEGGLQVGLDRFEDLVTGGAHMTEMADRYRKIAAGFTDRVRGVPADAWSNPAPPEGWDARDVVRHLVEWVPALLESGADIEIPEGPSVDDDPLGAWLNLSDTIQAILDEPGVSDRVFAHDRAGTHALDQAIGMFIMGDVLLHTWDLARATGQDETLDPDEVAGMYEGMLPIDDMLRQSGQYGPRVEVPDDADVQTKLIAFVGRQP